MSAPLDRVTGGLFDPTGLGRVTRGLVRAHAPVLHGFSATFGSDMVDIALGFDPTTFQGDVEIDEEKHDLVAETSLGTSVVLSLFSDRRAQPDDRIPGGGDDPRGWWGDSLSEIEGDQFGSRLWLLSREKQTRETLLRAKQYAAEALDWLIEDGIASIVRVDASFLEHALGWMLLSIEIERPDRSRFAFRFDYLWQGVA